MSLSSSLRQKINIKYFMVTYLGILLICSALSTQQTERLTAGIIIIVIYTVLDLAWTRIRDGVWMIPLSSWISALVISNVALVHLSIPEIILLPILAVCSKHLLHLGKNRHVWNPAAFAMGAMNLFIPGIAWWAASWGITPVMIISIAAIIILWRQKRWHVALPFFLSYAFFSLLLYLMSGSGFLESLQILPPSLFDGSLLFFATVMLIEPITSTFPKTSHRVTYGCFVGFFIVAVGFSLQYLPKIHLDPFITALLIGNLIASLLFLPSIQTPKSQIPNNG